MRWGGHYHRPKARIGLGPSLLVGAGLGLAIAATIAAARTTQLLASGIPVGMALTAGFRLAFLAGSAFAALGMVATLALMGPAAHAARTRRPMHRQQLRRQGDGPRRNVPLSVTFQVCEAVVELGNGVNPSKSASSPESTSEGRSIGRAPWP